MGDYPRRQLPTQLLTHWPAAPGSPSCATKQGTYKQATQSGSFPCLSLDSFQGLITRSSLRPQVSLKLLWKPLRGTREGSLRTRQQHSSAIRGQKVHRTLKQPTNHSLEWVVWDTCIAPAYRCIYCTVRNRPRFNATQETSNTLLLSITLPGHVSSCAF